jgi:quercetin dioxygenase-like cupin family protein
LSILVSGVFRVDFPDRQVRLSTPGEYVLFGPNVPHGWTAEADAVVVTIRWPSKPGDVGEQA